MSDKLKNFTVSDFDRFDCVKLSKTLYIALLFLLRGYLVWLMTITNFNDRTGIIELIYPNSSMFYLNLVSGSLGLFILLLISLRRPNAASWVINLWPRVLQLIIVALVIDMLVVSVAYIQWQLTSFTIVVVQLLFAAICILICIKSKRLKLNIEEFPEPLPDK
ncbi:DUF2919 domain-containing protein [Thalassotalea sp. M1531]|uniref:DUF2919 domain-containing protein n=1 Tax=Thalassotalea algicola TaxID=2716224 RepID=A0A7Y0LDX1_9GAMM|nr:DUF2919 family protein [Thalassotalea algicola]NMP32497.1 DUF2919 domain-containing protein [Thalassotalea algicola]